MTGDEIAEQDARGALALARQQGFEEGLEEARQEGRRQEKRAELLKLLATRGLTDAHRARIAACADADALDGWIDRAIGGAALAERVGTD